MLTNPECEFAFSEIFIIKVRGFLFSWKMHMILFPSTDYKNMKLF